MTFFSLADRALVMLSQDGGEWQSMKRESFFWISCVKQDLSG
jgi:hypothetical protein